MKTRFTSGAIQYSCDHDPFRFSPLPPLPPSIRLSQCCEVSCVSGPYYDRGENGYACLDPAFFDPGVIAKYPDCAGTWASIGNGLCDASNNIASCGYDGGDCCLCSCSGLGCLSSDFDCLDRNTHVELYACKASSPAALPCSTEEVRPVGTVVEASEQARALAAAVNCSGGSFEVEWRGRVVVDETIHVGDRTVLTVRGDDTRAVIDGNATTRLFTVVNATLHLIDVNVTSGASIAGGAIAAAGSVVTFNRTNFIRNIATGFGGAVFLLDGSNLSCPEEGAFANNRAKVSGGAMFVTDASTVSGGSSWLNNTAGVSGGAVFIEDNSNMSWREETMFSFNAAEYSGGALHSSNSSMSWSGPTVFFPTRPARMEALWP